MRLAHITFFEDFGTRSIAIHAVMVLAFVNAVLAALVVGGQVGLVSFIALFNFTAGLWVAHSVHSLGNISSDGEYSGVVNELLGSTSDSDAGIDTIGEADTETDTSGLDTGRFGRLLALIAAVTAVSLLTSAQVLPGSVLPLAVVAIGAIAVVTAITGFLIALGASYDDSEAYWADEVDRHQRADLEEQR
ncbi:hypothetical protein [Natronorubrum daqingense]|uniref:Uncharacterized protein n=1 Tax=Natronorubrum daqingense TaxID=588898 RepID=A0A1N7C7U6_9EURY|nr:hypothetical protein [Natronorubrum daqingense]APX96778.1 hypothetical protein BB347_09185 [Natronorubrum daqingense]SIR59583.1 hypothetical protein SAMN05421809_1559 [Natronorubrum daqingense]